MNGRCHRRLSERTRERQHFWGVIHAISRVASLPAEVPQDAKLDAKLVTFRDIRAGQKDVQEVPALKDDDKVWAVSVEGGFVPAFAKGAKYDWALVLVDPASGDVVATLAGNGSTCAPFFDSAADLGA